MRQAMVLFSISAMSILLTACSGTAPKSMTLAMHQPADYAHLYQSMEAQRYRDDSFEWVDRLPMPKRF